MLKLFSLQKVPPDFGQERLNPLKLCADSHDKFNHVHPLWKMKTFSYSFRLSLMRILIALKLLIQA